MPSGLDLVFTSSPSRRRSNIRFVLFPFLACLINLIEYFTGIWAWFLVEATIHGHMKPWWRTHGGWQDSRLVLSILTSISRGYELDSWAFPGLILYGGWLDWWPDIYILSSSTRDRSISRSEYSRGCLHWISLSRGFSRTLTRNLLVSPYVPGLILDGGWLNSWLEIWILSSSRRGNTARNQN